MSLENKTTALHSVKSVTATNETDVYILSVDITDMEGFRYTCDYVSRPEDTFGLNPEIREWLTQNLDTISVLPFVPPTAEELRASFPSLTKRQLRLALVRYGISLSTIENTIASLPEGLEKDEINIEWDSSSTFERLNPSLLTIAAALNLTPEVVDEMWNTALNI